MAQNDKSWRKSTSQLCGLSALSDFESHQARSSLPRSAKLDLKRLNFEAQITI
jgi:hypothetical protein